MLSVEPYALSGSDTFRRQNLQSKIIKDLVDLSDSKIDRHGYPGS